jgi:plastocyanin
MIVIVGCVHIILDGNNTHEAAFAEQKITIIPDAHSNTAVRFIDVKDYFIPVSEALTWFNDDFVDHKLSLTNEDNSTLIAALDLKTNGSITYTFEEPGKYYYSSKEYPKIQGSVRALDRDDILVGNITGLRNNVDVQLAWTPSEILLNQDNPVSDHRGDNLDKANYTGSVDFMITFIDNKTGINQEHIDYEFTINDELGNEEFKQGVHSTYGLEKAKYTFEKHGNFKPQVMITHILFSPVDPDIAHFDKMISIEK